MPADRLEHAVDVLQELPGQAALADPGRPGHRHEAGATLARRRVEEVLEQAQLVVAADERRLERLPSGPAPPALGHDAQGTPGRHRGGLALEDLLAAGSKTIAELAARWVASPTRTVPGGATDWRRLAVLTRSPATIPWPVAPRVTAASPVRTPARASSPRPSARLSSVRTASTQVERRPDGPLGVVLRGRPAPPRRP